jgi:hypothetical protein
MMVDAGDALLALQHNGAARMDDRRRKHQQRTGNGELRATDTAHENIQRFVRG